MLELYHGGSSVCSAKVRVGMAEKGLDYVSHPINLPKGEQFNPEYMKVNPKAVVPTVIHDGFKIFESSLILEYIDSLSDENRLMPTDPKEEVTAKLWLLRCLDIHAAINTMTFSTVNRQKMIANKSPEEIAASIAQIPMKKAREKRADVIENGIASGHVETDFFTLRDMFGDMQAALSHGKWMNGCLLYTSDAADE